MANNNNNNNNMNTTIVSSSPDTTTSTSSSKSNNHNHKHNHNHNNNNNQQEKTDTPSSIESSTGIEITLSNSEQQLHKLEDVNVDVDIDDTIPQLQQPESQSNSKSNSKSINSPPKSTSSTTIETMNETVVNEQQQQQQQQRHNPDIPSNKNQSQPQNDNDNDNINQSNEHPTDEEEEEEEKSSVIQINIDSTPTRTCLTLVTSQSSATLNMSNHQTNNNDNNGDDDDDDNNNEHFNTTNSNDISYIDDDDDDDMKSNPREVTFQNDDKSVMSECTTAFSISNVSVANSIVSYLNETDKSRERLRKLRQKRFARERPLSAEAGDKSIEKEIGGVMNTSLRSLNTSGSDIGIGMNTGMNSSMSMGVNTSFENIEKSKEDEKNSNPEIQNDNENNDVDDDITTASNVNDIYGDRGIKNKQPNTPKSTTTTTTELQVSPSLKQKQNQTLHLEAPTNNTTTNSNSTTTATTTTATTATTTTTPLKSKKKNTINTTNIEIKKNHSKESTNSSSSASSSTKNQQPMDDSFFNTPIKDSSSSSTSIQLPNDPQQQEEEEQRQQQQQQQLQQTMEQSKEDIRSPCLSEINVSSSMGIVVGPPSPLRKDLTIDSRTLDDNNDDNEDNYDDKDYDNDNDNDQSNTPIKETTTATSTATKATIANTTTNTTSTPLSSSPPSPQQLPKSKPTNANNDNNNMDAFAAMLSQTQELMNDMKQQQQQQHSSFSSSFHPFEKSNMSSSSMDYDVDVDGTADLLNQTQESIDSIKPRDLSTELNSIASTRKEDVDDHHHHHQVVVSTKELLVPLPKGSLLQPPTLPSFVPQEMYLQKVSDAGPMSVTTTNRSPTPISFASTCTTTQQQQQQQQQDQVNKVLLTPPIYNTNVNTVIGATNVNAHQVQQVPILAPVDKMQPIPHQLYHLGNGSSNHSLIAHQLQFPAAAVPQQPARRSMKLRLLEERRLTVPSSADSATGKRSLFSKMTSLRRPKAHSVGDDNDMIELELFTDAISNVERGTISVSWYEGTTTVELQEHVRTSVERKLRIGSKKLLRNFRVLDETVVPNEEIVLSSYIPHGSEFLCRFRIKDNTAHWRPPYRAPPSPSAAPSPPGELERLQDQIKMIVESQQTDSKPKPLIPNIITESKESKSGSESPKSNSSSKDGIIAHNELLSQRLEKLSETLLSLHEDGLYGKEQQYQPVEKRQVVFTIANYFILFLSLIAVSAEIHERAPRWVEWIDQNVSSVQNCAADRDALFDCVSQGNFSGLIASILLWATTSVSTKQLFLFGFDSPQKLWIVVYEAGVSAFCWGFSYMMIRRGLNPDTRPNFLTKYWKDAVYGGLAGFNAAFMKAVLKNLIPQEQMLDVLDQRQLRIVSFLGNMFKAHQPQP